MLTKAVEPAMSTQAKDTELTPSAATVGTQSVNDISIPLGSPVDDVELGLDDL